MLTENDLLGCYFEEEQQFSKTPKNKITKSPHHADKVLHKLNTFYKQRDFYDIVLIATNDRTEVHAHRVVLSASSDFFFTMFHGNLKESRTNEIELKDMDGTVLKSVVDFMYTGLIELNIETIENVMSAAGYFQMDTLIDCCCEFMGNRLDAENCWEMYFFAERHGYIELQDNAFDYAEKNFESLCAEKGFLQLTDDQLVQFLSSDKLGVSSEEIVFRCIVDWVGYDPKNRDKIMFELLPYVHAGHLTPKFITENRYLVCEKDKCSEVINHWLDWHSSAGDKTLLTEDQIRPRDAYNILTFASGFTSKFTIFSYNRALNTWSKKVPRSPLIEQVGYKIIQMGETLIIAGGKIDGDFTTRVECLNLHTWRLTELPPMPQLRWDFAMAELNDCLYIVGGYDGNNLLRTVLKYDFTVGTWEEVQPLPLSFSGIQAVVLNGLLIATGNFSSVMAMYDPESDKWTEREFKTERSKAFSLVVVNNQLYTVGGQILDGIKSQCIERYDLACDMWTRLKRLPEGRDGIKCAALNNRLIACGGSNYERAVQSVEEYNPETDKWESLSPMLTYMINPLCNLFVISGGRDL